MPKIAIISGCEDCPHFDNEYYDYAQWCNELNRPMDEDRDSDEWGHFPIPSDCPLMEANP